MVRIPAGNANRGFWMDECQLTEVGAVDFRFSVSSVRVSADQFSLPKHVVRRYRNPTLQSAQGWGHPSCPGLI